GVEGNIRAAQERLAKELHLSRQAVYKWESNKGYPDISNLIRMSDIFHVTIDDLIRKDQQLHNRITIDDDETFVQFSDFGFYLGIVFILLGAFLFEGTLADTLMIVGILSVVFFTDVVTLIKALFYYMISSQKGLE